MTTYDPGFWAELGQKLLSYYFNILSLLIQSFPIEIAWQITTVTVKSCEQLHLVYSRPLNVTAPSGEIPTKPFKVV